MPIPGWLNGILGAGETAFGAYAGSPGMMRAGMNRLRPNQVPQTPMGGGGVPTSAMGPAPVSPTAPPPMPPSYGPPITGMAQPTAFAPGAKSQIDATGMPQGPGFKFPSAQRLGMYQDGMGGYLQ